MSSTRTPSMRYTSPLIFQSISSEMILKVCPGHWNVWLRSWLWLSVTRCQEGRWSPPVQLPRVFHNQGCFRPKIYIQSPRHGIRVVISIVYICQLNQYIYKYWAQQCCLTEKLWHGCERLKAGQWEIQIPQAQGWGALVWVSSGLARRWFYSADRLVAWNGHQSGAEKLTSKKKRGNIIWILNQCSQALFV